LKSIRFVLAAAVLAALTASLSGCAAPTPESVGGLSVASVEKKQVMSTATTPPISYDVTIEWDTELIKANDKASAAFTGLKVYMMEGSTATQTATLGVAATSHTFTGILPGGSVGLYVEAQYAAGAFEDLSTSDTTESVRFIGGPWITGTTYTAPSYDANFSIGAFNNADGFPTSSFTLSDFYYYYPTNSSYLFSAAGEVRWLLVSANEVTATNDTDSQRNNIQWLSDKVYLLDKNSSGLSSYENLADVKVEIVDIYGLVYATISGTATQATMNLSTPSFSNLINNLDSGYYADRTGYFYVKATCESMPSTYSAANSSKLGYWGLAMPGARR